MCNCAKKREETRGQEAPDPVGVFDKQGIKTCFLYVNIWMQTLRKHHREDNMGAGQMYGFGLVKKKVHDGNNVTFNPLKKKYAKSLRFHAEVIS